MTQGQVSPVLRFIRGVRKAATAAGDGDAQLLDRFVTAGEEAAFGTLVQRHGPMVLSVCRRVLQNLQDAEDAFQATFMVLARQAASIRKRGALASWLYGVAHRVARKAQADDIRRRTREGQVQDMTPQASLPEAAWHELRAILDEELDRMPEKYRAPLVLCYLEGKTNEEAAAALGWTKGTVSGRLARARDLLRGRLTRRGLALSAGMLVGLFGAGTAPAAVPGTLLNTTVLAATSFAAGKAAIAGAAAALAEGVMRALFVTKCKFILGVVLSLGLVAGGTGVLVQAVAGDGTEPAEAQAAATAQPIPQKALAGPQPVQEPVQELVQEPVATQEKSTPPEGQPKRNAVQLQADSQNNLKQIGIAMHNYHDVFQTFPAHAIHSKDGKPLLSWRVAILPFIFQDQLYRSFKLDEPWDSEHNKKLLARMPRTYAALGVKTKTPHSTFYRVFVGPGTAFEGKEGHAVREFTDGTSNTLLAVEAGEAVPWTKPEELSYDANKALPKLGGVLGGDFNVLLADGSTRFVRRGFNERVFRDILTRSGGEIASPADLNP
jgi:RNA polymerase sigma factor (sigma-70 family)